MTRAVKELAQGQAFGRSVDNSQAADTSERNFRVVLSSPNEVYSPQAVCGVYVGDRHPLNPYLTCSGFDAKFDGESRLVNIVSFRYGSNPGQEDAKQQEPSVRPPLWSTSTSLQDTPVIVWKRRYSDTASGSSWTAPVNPAGDRYEGISKLEPITTISIEQYEAIDPTRNIKYVGRVNSAQVVLGSLVMPPRSLMFRGLQSKPHVEPFGSMVWRGWLCTYEFAFRDNITTYYASAGEVRDSIGWDITQIVEGYNIINDGLNDATVDQGALAYTLDDNGAVTPSWDARTLVEANKKYRACVKVSAPGGDPNRKISQRPAAQPVALNANGTPRNVETQDPKVLVYRYQIYEDCDFKKVLGLRF
jgi:hypothetical protein